VERGGASTAAWARAADLEARYDVLMGSVERARREARDEGQRLGVERALEKERARHASREQELQEEFQQELDTMLERLADLETELEAARRQAESQLEQAKQEQARASAPEATVDAQTASGFAFQIDELKKALAEARNERNALKAPAGRVPELERELGELRARLEQERHRADAAARRASEDELVSDHETEVSRLEALLTDRAKLVDELRVSLRESERIGHELARELGERARQANGEPTTQGDPARVELEGLLQKCSRYEADLQAANWKIAALSSQLDEGAESSSDHQALEEALRQARDELAQLRRRLEDE
jgi:DNA repair exonuclease SbcCD ATPase subunit